MLNSIYEQRKRLKDGYHISLLIPRTDYVAIYGSTFDKQSATEIVNSYLQHKDDDGRPKVINVYNHNDSNMVEIEAILNYIENEHTDYDSDLQ